MQRRTVCNPHKTSCTGKREEVGTRIMRYPSEWTPSYNNQLPYTINNSNQLWLFFLKPKIHHETTTIGTQGI